MLSELKNNELIRVLLVLVLGLIFFDLLFSLLFGSNQMMVKYTGIINVVIQLLMLVLVGMFIYGFYSLLKEQAGPLWQQLVRQVDSRRVCLNCGQKLGNHWNCCPYCGSEAASERN